MTEEEFSFCTISKARAILRDTRIAANGTHTRALKLGSLSSLCVATSILTAYCNSGLIDDARQMFDEMPQRTVDVVTWNSIISGCIRNGRDNEAIQYFKQMQCCKKLGLDSYTLSNLVSSTFCLEKSMNAGEQIHGHAIKTGFFSSFSVGNALITFYAKWGKLFDSKLVFQTMPQRNVISWTALISGFAQSGQGEESLSLFLEMTRHDQKPNQFTFASAFSSCSEMATLSQGKILISPALKMGFLSDIHVQNSLVSFYSACGSLEEAETMFETISEPDLVSWNSLLKAHSQQGKGKQSLQILKEMRNMGVEPDSITFLTILSALKNSTMVTEALALFQTMVKSFKLEPQTEHIACMVGLLGRAGRFDQALEFINGHQLKNSASVWKALLGACRVHGNAELAEMAAEQQIQIEPQASETFTVLSNMYAEIGRWEMVGEVRCLMKERRVVKEPGFSWVEVGNRIHCFYVADRDHPQIDEIEKRLIELYINMKHGDGDSDDAEAS